MPNNNKHDEAQAVRAAQAAYAREWRKRNPEKAAEYTKRYWAKKALQMKDGTPQEK